ncbi:MAG: hypothetical protein ED559_13025 [Phycisphaera sp.]|nr:MAG: hypothetical protein ED559_13025 [Phycisphaera sp.]
MLITAALVIASLFAPKAEPVAIEDLSFLAGSWRGDVFGSLVEETWLSPEEGNMTGVFRMTGEEKVDLVEIMTLTETDDGLMYRLRHFDTALVPWASEVDGPIVGRAELIDEDSVRFVMTDPESDVEAIVYDLEGDTLVATVNFVSEERDPFRLEFDRVD